MRADMHVEPTQVVPNIGVEYMYTQARARTNACIHVHTGCVRRLSTPRVCHTFRGMNARSCASRAHTQELTQVIAQVTLQIPRRASPCCPRTATLASAIGGCV